MVGMFNSALRTEGGADNANRIGAVALNFEVKAERRSFNGYQISILTLINQGECQKMYGYK